MSQLFDSLRRAGRSRPVVTPRQPAGPSPEHLIEKLGLRRAERGRWTAGLAAALAVAALGASAAWYVLHRPVAPVTPASAPSSADTSAPPPPPSSRPAPATDSKDTNEVARVALTTTPAGPAPTARATPDGSAVAETRPDRPRRPPARAQPEAAPALDEFRRAADLQRDGDLDAAAAIYRSLIARGDLTAEVHNNLGLLYQARGMHGDAVREFGLAVAARPAYAAAHNNLGVALLAQGRIPDAEASFRRATEADRRDAGAVVNLALAQKAARRFERARETLLRALTIAPDDAPAHYNLAVLYEQAGERGRAVAHYRAFLEHAGREHEAHVAPVRSRLEALQRLQ